MTDRQLSGRDVFKQMVPGALGERVASLGDAGFADELAELAIEHVFAALWNRQGLDRRSRSLVTLGILIALRGSDELKIHFPMALRNGLTVEELEEVVYHSAGYAGYPAASHARSVAQHALGSTH